MAEDFGETIVSSEEEEGEKKDNRLWIIIAVVVIVLCCCCIAVGFGGYWLWENGDSYLDLSVNSLNLLLQQRVKCCIGLTEVLSPEDRIKKI